MSKRVVAIDVHPLEEALLIRYSQDLDGNLTETQKIIHLKDFSSNVDVASLSSVVLARCPDIPPSHKQELEQTLFYLQKRKSSDGGSASSVENGAQSEPLNADINEIESYLEMFYEDISEKRKAATLFLELSKQKSYILQLAEDETIIGTISRVFREDFKKSFELATTIANIFLNFSYYNQFHVMLTHHKIGGLCLNIVDHEIKRKEIWQGEMKTSDQKIAKKCESALKKQDVLLCVCFKVLINLATDINVELKMVRRDLVAVLLKSLQLNQSSDLMCVLTNFLLKLSIFDENKSQMEQPSVIAKLLSNLSIENVELKKSTIRLLFNLSFDTKCRAKMVEGGLVAYIAPYIQDDQHALNLLYQLSINDDAKAMITFTDSIQILMRDLLSGGGSEVTKAVLLNACVEKRNAQLVCGADGSGLDLLLDLALNSKDLVIAKILRTIAAHDGPTQELFNNWVSQLLSIGITEGTEPAEERAAMGLECFATAALIRTASWAKLATSLKLIEWMADNLRIDESDKHPLQLQIVIMCGTMARKLESARLVVPLLETFLNALQTLQTDDEFVVQLLSTFLQLLRHKELADRLMGTDSELGLYVIDLMHDKNPTIREMCENALVIIGEHSQEWARKIAAERFRWHNAEWLSMIECGGEFEELPANDDYEGDVLFHDQLQFDDGFDGQLDEDAEERLF